MSDGLSTFLAVGQRLQRGGALTSPDDWAAELRLAYTRARYDRKSCLGMQKAMALEARYRRWHGIIYA